jgi:hypothetical protein
MVIHWIAKDISDCSPKPIAMSIINNFQVIQGNQAQKIGDRGTDLWVESFNTRGRYSNGQAILTFMVRGLTDSDQDVDVLINDTVVGSIGHYYGGDPRHWFSQTVQIDEGVLRNGENTLRIEATGLPVPRPGNLYDDFYIKDVVCFFQQEVQDLKTVSGVLITRGHPRGSVLIDLGHNRIEEGDLAVRDLGHAQTVAPPGMRNNYFIEEPCRTIGLREIKAVGNDNQEIGGRPPRTETERFWINSSVRKYGESYSRLFIEWGSQSDSEIEEITYLVIGPVSNEPEAELI